MKPQSIDSVRHYEQLSRDVLRAFFAVIKPILKSDNCFDSILALDLFSNEESVQSQVEDRLAAWAKHEQVAEACIPALAVKHKEWQNALFDDLPRGRLYHRGLLFGVDTTVPILGAIITSPDSKSIQGARIIHEQRILLPTNLLRYCWFFHEELSHAEQLRCFEMLSGWIIASCPHHWFRGLPKETVYEALPTEIAISFDTVTAPPPICYIISSGSDESQCYPELQRNSNELQQWFFWYIEILIRQIKKDHRKCKEVRFSDIRGAGLDIDTLPSQPKLLVDFEEMEQLHSFLETLTPKQRQIIELKLTGLNASEIAKLIGGNPYTVKEHIDRTGPKLSKFLASQRI